MDYAALAIVLVGAFVIAQGVDKFVKPLLDALRKPTGTERAQALVALWPFYATVLVGGSMAWFTGLNFLPVFVESPLLGRVLTCCFMALGPAFIHDIKKQIVALVIAFGNTE